MTEDFVRLNKDEIDVLLDSLQLIDIRQEQLIQDRTKVSIPALYNKLYSASEDLK